MNTYWVQIDVRLEELSGRFYMNDCGGHDPLVACANQGGWRSPEAPLPEVLAKLCRGWKPVFIDVAANTGYFSLLAAVAGARKVYACEPEPGTYQTLGGNVVESARQGQISLLPLALGDGSSLDSLAQVHVSDLAGQQVLVRMDAQSRQFEVIKGGSQFIRAHRPVMLVEVLPDAQLGFLDAFCAEQKYRHMCLRAGQPMELSVGPIAADAQHSHHLLIPTEKTGAM